MSLSLLAGYGSSDEEDNQGQNSDAKEEKIEAKDDTATSSAKVDPPVKKIKLPSALDLLSGNSSALFSSGPFVGECIFH
jgi:hypothetical protein